MDKFSLTLIIFVLYNIGKINLNILLKHLFIMFGMFWILLEHAYKYMLEIRAVKTEDIETTPNYADNCERVNDKQDGKLINLKVSLLLHSPNSTGIFNTGNDENKTVDPDLKYLSKTFHLDNIPVNMKPKIQAYKSFNTASKNLIIHSNNSTNYATMSNGNIIEKINSNIITIKEVKVLVNNVCVFEENRIQANHIRSSYMSEENSIRSVVIYKKNLPVSNANTYTNMKKDEMIILQNICKYIISYLSYQLENSRIKSAHPIDKLNDRFHKENDKKDIIIITLYKNLNGILLTNLLFSKCYESDTQNQINACNWKKREQIKNNTIVVESEQNKLKCERNQNFKFKNVEEYENVLFSMKQCHGSLRCVVPKNYRFTKSRLASEIEKELKPIKRQIDELRETMVTFNLINSQCGIRGMEISPIKIWPSSDSNLSIFSVYSQHNASIHCVSKQSQLSIQNIPQSNKLSPMAEMYIKLSQY